ncbi:MAG: RNA-binding S4 domain-containing protein [Ruminococcaceae bacterium]|nr:RNA-binding S4 domain-containing protein [Oscillospiraceae bacterium]
MNTVQVTIRTEFIRMDALLKLAGLVMTGGEAKAVIQGGEVTFNGETCLMRGKKVRQGDKVGYDGNVVEVIGE